MLDKRPLIKVVVIFLLGVVFAGCGRTTAKPIRPAPRLIAEVAGSPCTSAPASVHAVSAASFVNVENRANNVSNQAVAALGSGRFSLQTGQVVAAQISFQTARRLFGDAQLTMQSVIPPHGLPTMRTDLRDACNFYVKAIESFRTGIASNNRAFTRQGEAQTTRGDQLEGEAWNLLQAGSDAVNQREADATYQASAGAASASDVSAGASKGSTHGATVHSATATHGPLPTAHRISKQVLPQRQTAARRPLPAAHRISTQGLPKRQTSPLSYVASIETMAGWVGVNGSPWQPVRYAVPFDGLTAIVSSPGAGASAYMAPYSIRHENYSVEARIRLMDYNNQAKDLHEGFGIFIRAQGTDGNTGIRAGVLNISAPQGLLDSPAPTYSYAAFTSGGANLQPHPGYASFQPGTNTWHTYRLNVRGEDATLLIDGMEAARMTTNQSFQDRRIGLFSVNSQIDVRDFTVSDL